MLLPQVSFAQERPGSITVAIDDSYPPYIFRNSDGQLQGILKDLWALWSDKTGIRVEMVATDWGKAQQLIYSGQADVIDDMFRSPERERLLDFSSPYATIEVPIFFHASVSGISNVADLRGFTVGVVEGDVVNEWLNARGISNLRRYPSYEALVKAAGNDEVRVFCMGKPQALFYLYKNNLEEQFRHSPPLFFGQLHWATLKGSKALHTIVADGFAKISTDEHVAIEKKWLGNSLQPAGNGRYLKYVAATLLIALVILGVLLFANRLLRRKVAERTTELSTTMNALRTSEHDSRMLFETSMLGLALCRMDGTLVDVNQAYADILGCTIPEALRLTYWQITPPEYALHEQQQLENLRASGHYGPYDKEYIHKSGKRIPVRLNGRLIERNGEPLIWSSVEDITLYKATEDRMNYLAFHDMLTGLPNRLLAQDRLEQAIAHADREHSKVAMLFLDLDNFKTINDSLGHTVGDGLLKAVAIRLADCLRESDSISRLGGDEFLIILPGVPDADSLMPVLNKLEENLKIPFDVDGHELSATASTGIAIYPDDGKNFDTLLKNADIAMYQAKDSGRNSYHFYDERLQADSRDKLTMTNALRRALERNELQLHYQPQIELTSGKTIGAEALLRWQHPEQGMIAPMKFIPLAEDSGLIVPIGDWVLQEACRQAVEWQLAGAPELVIAVNLSSVQFRRGKLEQSVLQALESSGINPWLLELELTESILIDNTENTLDTVRRLKSLGVKLSIDDFGTGYSSLSYLRRFAVDKLKIDRSFIRDLASDPEDAAIVRAIIQMAKSLGLKTIAEGIEDVSMLERLRLFNCDEGQGYHFARPMPPEEFTAYLQRPETRLKSQK